MADFFSRPVAVAALVVVAAGVAGCGGGAAPAAAPGPASAAPAAPGPEPGAGDGSEGPAAPVGAAPKPGESKAAAAQRLLDAAAAKLHTAKTGRLTWTARLSTAAGRLTQNSRQSYDLAADRWAAEVSVRAATGQLTFDYAAAGRKVYVSFKQGMPAELADRWLGLDRSDVPELETGRAVFDALAEVEATAARKAGRTTVVRGTLPAARALDLLALSGVPELAGRQVAGSAPVEIRLDPGGRVAGLAMDGADVRMTGSVPESVRRSVAGSSLVVDLGGFGAPVRVTTPKTWMPVEAGDLPS